MILVKWHKHTNIKNKHFCFITRIYRLFHKHIIFSKNATKSAQKPINKIDTEVFYVKGALYNAHDDRTKC